MTEGTTSSQAATLVIVPCGKAKVWDRDPCRGPTPARDAYTGHPFKVNRAYAERFGHAWMVLSAKYGFIEPQFLIPGPYDTTFKRRLTGPITVAELREQVQALGLCRFVRVIGLGGQHYREAMVVAFRECGGDLHFPFAGLSLGKSVQATLRELGNH